MTAHTSETPQRPQGGRDVLVFLFAPTLANAIFVMLVFSLPQVFAEAIIASYLLAVVSFALVTASFIPTFKDTIADLFAILVLVVNVMLFIVLNAGLHLAYEATPDIASCNNFADCLYFSVVTFTTLGYGDFQPTEKLRLLAAFHALFGYLSLGFIVAIANDLAKHGARRDNNHWGLSHILFWLSIKRLLPRPKQTENKNTNLDACESQDDCDHSTKDAEA